VGGGEFDGHVASVGVARGVFEKLSDVGGEWLGWEKVRSIMGKRDFVGCFLAGLGMMMGYQLTRGGEMQWS